MSTSLTDYDGRNKVSFLRENTLNNQSWISANHASLISNKSNSRSSTFPESRCALESPFSSLSGGSWRGASGFLSRSRTICKQSWRKVSPARGARSGCSGGRARAERGRFCSARVSSSCGSRSRGGLSKALNSSQVSPPLPPFPRETMWFECEPTRRAPLKIAFKPETRRLGAGAHTRYRLCYAYHDRLCRISANYIHTNTYVRTFACTRRYHRSSSPSRLDLACLSLFLT